MQEDNNQLIPVWKEKGIASIGWPKLENPKQYHSKAEMISKATSVYSDEKPQSRNSWLNQEWRFSREIQIGDRVISYSKEKKEYIIGTVTESHFYDNSFGNPDYPNTIRVAWALLPLQKMYVPE